MVVCGMCLLLRLVVCHVFVWCACLAFLFVGILCLVLCLWWCLCVCVSVVRVPFSEPTIISGLLRF